MTAPRTRSAGRNLGADADERAALAWAHSARFLTTASALHQLPPPDLPEVAFVGRSNAGKSSAINALAQHKRLAFASKTPGRTQHVNLFALGPPDAPNALWADLPGYGYAAVERAAKQRWQSLIGEYLGGRESLVGLVLLADPRLGLTELDLQLLDWVAPSVQAGTLHLLVLLTKADKLNRRERERASSAAQRALAELASAESDIGVCLFSAMDKTGVADAALTLRQWIQSENLPPAPAIGAP